MIDVSLSLFSLCPPFLCRPSTKFINVLIQPSRATMTQTLPIYSAETPRATSEATSMSRAPSTSHGRRSTANYRMLRIPSSSARGTSRPVWRPRTRTREFSTIIFSPGRDGSGRDGPRSGLTRRSITITCLIAVLRMRLALRLAYSWIETIS